MKYFTSFSTYPLGDVTLGKLANQAGSDWAVTNFSGGISTGVVVGEVVVAPSSVAPGGKGLLASSTTGGGFAGFLRETLSTSITISTGIAGAVQFGGGNQPEWDILLSAKLSTLAGQSDRGLAGGMFKGWFDDRYDGAGQNHDEYAFVVDPMAYYFSSTDTFGFTYLRWFNSSPVGLAGAMDSTLPFELGANYFVRHRYDLSTGGFGALRSKIWKAGDPEPSTWLNSNPMTVANTTSTEAGAVGIRFQPNIAAGDYRNVLFAMAASDDITNPVTEEQLIAQSTSLGAVVGFRAVLRWST